MEPIDLARRIASGLIEHRQVAESTAIEATMTSVRGSISGTSGGESIALSTTIRVIDRSLAALDAGAAAAASAEQIQRFAALPPGVRAAVALSEFCELDDDSVAAIVDRPVGVITAILDAVSHDPAPDFASIVAAAAASAGTPTPAPAPSPAPGPLTTDPLTTNPPATETPTAEPTAAPTTEPSGVTSVPLPPPLTVPVLDAPVRERRRSTKASTRTRWWVIAAVIVRLMHEAGVPPEALNLVIGDGPAVGAPLTADPRLAGVVFTGSTEVARSINRTLAGRDGPIATLIAETGGLNAMIADSTALPEQLVRDALTGAFDSAGQRCSALRVLFVQDGIAGRVTKMLAGAMEELAVGDPMRIETDVGPVIDAEALTALEAHAARMGAEGKLIARAPLAAADGHFFAPAAFEIDAIARLTRETFGPILHVVRYKGDKLGAVCEAINATGYGLTLGIHTRIASSADEIAARVRAGNIYVNRNQIGAVVEAQPFGGEGLSGTGPKAGGPHYLHRFATERTLSVNTTAAGGNASLLSLGDGG